MRLTCNTSSSWVPSFHLLFYSNNFSVTRVSIEPARRHRQTDDGLLDPLNSPPTAPFRCCRNMQAAARFDSASQRPTDRWDLSIRRMLSRGDAWTRVIVRLASLWKREFHKYHYVGMESCLRNVLNGDVEKYIIVLIDGRWPSVAEIRVRRTSRTDALRRRKLQRWS